MRKKIAQFQKVSLKQFMDDWISTFENRPDHIITEIYNSIKMPKRATNGSAGYDFFSPINIILKTNETIKFLLVYDVKSMTAGCLSAIQEAAWGLNTACS